MKSSKLERLFGRSLFVLISFLILSNREVSAQTSTIVVRVMQGNNPWVLTNAQTTEVTLGTTTVVPGTTTAQLQRIFTVVNNSSSARSFSVVLPSGFTLSAPATPSTIAPWATGNFTLAVIPSKEGLRSGNLQVVLGADRVTIPVGAMVWPKNGQPISPIAWNASLPQPYPTNSPAPATASKTSELLSLAMAREAAEYRSIRSSLSLKDTESVLIQVAPQVGELVISANRSAFSSGAKLAYDSDLAALQATPVSDLMNTLNKILTTTRNDKSAKARLAALTIFNQLSERVASLKPVMRLYTQSFLVPEFIFYLSELNAAGKIYLLQGLVKSYLQTDPPVTEALQIIDPLVRSLTDPVVKTAIVKMTISKYPTKFTRLASVPVANTFSPVVPTNLAAGAVCRGGAGTQTCRSGLVCAVHNLCSPPGTSLSPAGQMCRTQSDCIPGTTCVTSGTTKVCQ